jgi:hypothetical protein
MQNFISPKLVSHWQELESLSLKGPGTRIGRPLIQNPEPPVNRHSGPE